MRRSNRLRLAEVRAAFRLVGECREMGRDPDRWRAHLFAGVGRLVGARVGIGGECRWPRGSADPLVLTAVDTGFDPAERAAFAAFMRAGGVRTYPVMNSFADRRRRLTTRTRPQIVRDADWYRCPSYEYHRASRVDHQIGSLYERAAGGAVSYASFHRTAGEPHFTPGEARLVHLCHAEAGRLIGTALAAAAPDPVRPLFPRLRQTLDCLLAGASEKQAAARLGVSRATAHQYVMALYRRSGGRTRAELLACFVAPARPR